MKRLFVFALLICAFSMNAQERINPIIKNYGGIFDAPHSTEKPDPNMEYKIIIDVVTGSEDKDKVYYALNNVARLINLHAMGGVPKENLKIVLAVHGGAAWSVLNNEQYNENHGVDNPNIELYKELQEAGVKVFVCSQSLLGRKLDHEKLLPGIEVATSMLTVMTTHQLKGYAVLKF